jgi:RimJ/RimL family protein N-acetyltransferase
MHKMLLELSSQLETERLIIRPYQKGDGVFYFSLLEDNREHLKEHVDSATTVTNEEEAEIKIRELAADWVGRTRFVMGVWEKVSSTYIGEIWIEPANWEVPSFEVGWFLDKTYEGKGLATEAVKASLTFLFEDLNAHKVIAKARETNVKSFRLAERCGFVKEGLLRDNARKKDNTLVGLLCYGMLESEYKQLKSA